MPDETTPPTWPAGPWKALKYLTDDHPDELRAAGIEPVRALDNAGAMPIMTADGPDRFRVALVDCQSVFKRGQGHQAECAQRDATALLIAAAPTQNTALESAPFPATNENGEDFIIRYVRWYDGMRRTAVALARGEPNDRI